MDTEPVCARAGITSDGINTVCSDGTVDNGGGGGGDGVIVI